MVTFSTRQLRAFLLVAHHRSFARAAEGLFITPSGLSLMIRELETQLGFRLFDRTTRHVVVTEQAAALLPVVRRSLDEMDAAIADLGVSTRAADRTLSIGAPPLIAANILPHAIHEFRVHHAGVAIRLVDANLTTIQKMIEAGELDMGLGAFFGPAPGTRRTALFRFSLAVIRPDVNEAARRTTTTWSALRGETLVSLPAASPLQRLIDKQLTRVHGVHSGPVVNSLDTQIAMVEAGEGVAVIPSYGLPACRNRHVAMSRLVNPIVDLDFSQIRARGRKLSTEAEQFTVFLKGHMARWAGRAGVQ